MSGTFTYLFTDIEGSTRLVESLGESFGEVLADHRRILRKAASDHGGTELGTEGDGCFFYFGRATDAVSAAVAGQRDIAGYTWPEGAHIKVRMGLHTGEARVTGESHVGLAVHKASRICDAAHGGQILASQITHDLVAGSLTSEIAVRDLGAHRLKDLGQPERIFQITPPGGPDEFSPLRTLDNRPNNLPSLLTSFIGREKEIEELKEVVGRARLVTVLGPGGAGKTRLVLQTAAELLEPFESSGVWFVDLSTTTEGEHVPGTVASALGLRAATGAAAAHAPQASGAVDLLISHLKGSRALLIIDNCEHLIQGSAELISVLLASCAELSVIATSREPLSIPGEIRWRIPPLQLADALEGEQSEAVQLFVDRASINDLTFTLDESNVEDVTEICRRLDGMPLAIELAAAWVNTLTPAQILSRLDDQFRLLAASVRRGPERQHTLRAAIDWSYRLLSEDERRLLDNLAVFSGSFSLEAAEDVCATGGLTSGEILHVLSRLIDKSLVFKEADTSRFRLVESIRQYGLEKLSEATEEPASSALHTSGWVLRKDGEFWSVGPLDSPYHLKDSKGLAYLHILLAKPGQEFHVLDLVAGIEGTDRSGVRRALGQQSDAGEQIDPTARKAYLKKIADLEEEAEEASGAGDAERRARALEEKQVLESELAAAYGLGGRARRMGGAAERARMSVGKAIRGAIGKVEEQDAELGRHLRRSVKTGVFCTYAPDPGEESAWQL